MPDPDLGFSPPQPTSFSQQPLTFNFPPESFVPPGPIQDSQQYNPYSGVVPGTAGPADIQNLLNPQDFNPTAHFHQSQPQPFQPQQEQQYYFPDVSSFGPHQLSYDPNYTQGHFIQPPEYLRQLSTSATEPTISSPNRLTIKLPPMPAAISNAQGAGPSGRAGLRRSARHRTTSGTPPSSVSEYQQSERSYDQDEGADGDKDGEGEEEQKPVPVYHTSLRGRRLEIVSYKETDSEGPEGLFNGDENVEVHTSSPRNGRNRRSTRSKYTIQDDDDEDMETQPRHKTRSNTQSLNGFIVSDEEDHQPRRHLRTRLNKALQPTRGSSRLANKQQNQPKRTGRTTRNSSGMIKLDHEDQVATRSARRAARATRTRQTEDNEPYVQHTSPDSGSGDGWIDDAVHTSSEVEPEPEPELEEEHQEEHVDGEGQEIETDGKPYALRQRVKVDYALPPPLEEVVKQANPKGGGGGQRRHGGGKKRPRLGWSASGAELGRLMGLGDDSDSDYTTRTPRKQPFGSSAPGLFGTGAVAGSAGGVGVLPSELAAAAGTPSNLGKVGSESALADADPLGPNQNVTFEDVGGLDEHIHSLKEMTLLPLLYPEVFHKFGITPPRGVLFHGPPGTGKTLLARALAASCRSNGKGISFYMRKGADCLSKWVGEAERQLRLLFEEARNTQPSIIFFDEIDGLAPVRSSKQDQIHASIVSTLLALMDGMDGRGQVVVIGATNRPDAVDPALRRPGRFDREFYFGLPGLEAREKILGIMTKRWKGWALDSDDGQERLKGLANLTKGYGGADLRALCTEAALNAVQRRYPQIYKSTDRLLLAPDTIQVQLRDFMVSIKKLIPSSARSSTSTASPLPSQFIPLLSETLDKIKELIARVIPLEKKRSVLEEAEYEDVGGEDEALEREMMMQSMEKLRVYRPRIVLHGPIGMGQGYLGAAILHHLEGYNVQNLELGTLMGDSTRTAEAAIVQLFVEAKRHQPSIIYIPSLVGWCAAISETARSTVRAMLDTLAPTDPMLLLAVVDGPFSSLPRDVKGWFGHTRENRIELLRPTASQREAFFEGLLKDVHRPPNMFADGVKRRKRVLEELPIAPPLEPRQPTAAELAVQEENDQKVITLLKFRLGPILTELKRKFKRFTKRATEEYDFDLLEATVTQVETVMTSAEVQSIPNGIIEIVDEERAMQPLVNDNADAIPEDPFAPQQQQQVQQPQLFDMDLERMHIDLYKGKYLTPQDFLDDVGKMVHNAQVRMLEDPDRFYKAQAMYTATEVSLQDFDPHFRVECERMAAREQKRREEYKKNKNKNKPVEESLQNGNNGLIIRRSARTNGQQPEIPLTDPVKLERRLKRQRNGEAGGDSNGSEEEGADSRSNKRSRTLGSDDDDRDPLALGTPVPSTPLRPGVRFGGATEIEPTGAVREISPLDSHPPAPLVFPLSQLSPQPEVMSVDPSPRKTGFDPSLLNPAPEDNPFLDRPPLVADAEPAAQHQSSLPIAQPEGTTDVPSMSQPTEPIVSTQSAMDISPSHTPVLVSEPQLGKDQSPVPIIVERSPTPPLPDFIIDGDAVTKLATELRERTSTLNVEQLEQLRATGLGCVWRHRTEWNRAGLLKELSELLEEFVQEANEDDLETGELVESPR